MRKLIILLLALALLASASFVAFAADGILVSPSITATAAGPHQVDVNWEPAPGETTGYTIKRSNSDQPNINNAVGSVTANVYNYTDTSVNPNSTYYYSVTPIYLQSQSRGMDYQKALVTTPAEPSSSSDSSSTASTSASTEQTPVTTVVPETPQDDSRVTTLKIGSQEMIVQGKTTVLDVAPRVENGRTLVPLRAISEALGAEVTWDEQTQTVTVISRQGN